MTDPSYDFAQSALGPYSIGTTFYWSVTAVAGDGTQRSNDRGVQSFTTKPYPSNPHPLYTPPPDVPPNTQNPPPVGPWAALTNQPPAALSNCLLLTDARVICQRVATTSWYALTPTNTGSYVNGSWSQIGSLPTGYAPLYYSSAVLPDGRVIIMGGEYECTGSCTAVWQKKGAIYNPRTNAWASQAAPSTWTTLGDAMAIVLVNGTYMQTDCCSSKAAFLNASTLTWTSSTGVQLDNNNDEEGWVLLPDGTVLNVDVWSSNTKQTERYNPATDTWSSAGSTPSLLADNTPHANLTSRSFELGPGLLRPDGTVFWLGAAGEPTATGHSAIYTTSTNTWSAGPDIPSHDGANDSPAAVLPNRNVLTQLAPASATNVFGTPSHFYEFDGTNLNLVGLPTNCVATCNFPSYIGGMLVLPTGEVLLTEQSGHLELYTGSGSPNPSWLPTITSVSGTIDRGKTYTISGTQFNGLGVGSTYGDDQQSATNFPLVRITNRATNHVFYAKTHDHSSMGVATGSATVSTQFDVPVGTETGLSDIEVIANGIVSAKTAITISAVAPPPTVTVNQAVSQLDPSTVSTVNFTVTFSTAVSGFTSGSVTISGTAPGTKNATVTGAGPVYNVAVTGMTGSGTVIVAVLAGVVTDSLAVSNLISTSTDNVVTFTKKVRGQMTTQ